MDDMEGNKSGSDIVVKFTFLGFGGNPTYILTLSSETTISECKTRIIAQCGDVSFDVNDISMLHCNDLGTELFDDRKIGDILMDPEHSIVVAFRMPTCKAADRPGNDKKEVGTSTHTDRIPILPTDASESERVIAYQHAVAQRMLSRHPTKRLRKTSKVKK